MSSPESSEPHGQTESHQHPESDNAPNAPDSDDLDHSELHTSDPLEILSKSALKRLRKAERLKEFKEARRRKDKEKKVEKKRKRQEAIAAGEDVGPARKKTKPSQPKRFPARVVVDLGFDDKMTEKEVQSLCSQLSYTYSSNRKAPFCFSELLFTTLNGRTRARLTNDLKGDYSRWKGVRFWEEGYDRLWKTALPADAIDGGEGSTNHSLSDAIDSRALPKAVKETVVYLTADAEDELAELKEGETYIIGGLVDRNRYKNICKDKATKQQIRTARLPIGTYLSELPTRKVLTVNQVFDILLTWLEKRDWREAFWKQVPKRKFQGNEEKRVEDAGDGDGGDGDSQADLNGSLTGEAECLDGSQILLDHGREIDDVEVVAKSDEGH